MKCKIIFSTIAVFFITISVNAGEIDGGAVLGSVIGAGAGSAIGSATGGRNGAIVGGGLGGALGAAVGGSREAPRPTTQRVMIEDRGNRSYDHYEHREHHEHHDNGKHKGQRKHKHKDR